MPKFTLIKHPDFDGDPSVTMTFETEHAQVLQDNLKDFVSGSGFTVSLGDDDDDMEDDYFERRLTQDDFVAKEEDYEWNDTYSESDFPFFNLFTNS